MFEHTRKAAWAIVAIVCLGFIAASGSMAQNEATQLEHTKAAQRLIDSLLNIGLSRKLLASAILDYCADTSKNLPSNSQKENEQLAAALDSNDIKRIQRVGNTMQAVRWHFQNALTECMQNSRKITEGAAGPLAEAALWIKLEGAFDLAQVEYLATRLGIFREDENRGLQSDLHAIRYWGIIRVVSRQHAITLLQGH